MLTLHTNIYLSVFLIFSVYDLLASLYKCVIDFDCIVVNAHRIIRIVDTALDIHNDD